MQPTSTRRDQNTSPKKVCIVTGMHRCGTSLAATVLRDIGIHFGDNLLGSKRHSVQGYMENFDILNANMSILQTLCGERDSGLLLGAEAYADAGLASVFAETIETAIANTLHGPEPTFGCKDPRFCLTLPFWRSHLDGHDLKVVVAVRNPLDTALSLRRRNYFDIRRGLLMWMKYYGALASAVADLPSTVLLFDNLISDEETERAKLRTFLYGRTAPAADAAPPRTDQALIHHRSTLDDLTAECAGFPELVETFTRFLALDGMENVPRREWDAIRDLCKTLEPCQAFARVLTPVELAHVGRPAPDYAQSKLYLDFGNGYCEQDTLLCVESDRPDRHRFELSAPCKVAGIRFDPCEDLCAVRLDSAKVTSLNGEESDIPLAGHNATQTIDGVYYFNHPDPNFFFDVPQAVSSLVFDVQIMALGIEMFQQLKSAYADQGGQLQQRTKAVAEGETRLKQLGADLEGALAEREALRESLARAKQELERETKRGSRLRKEAESTRQEATALRTRMLELESDLREALQRMEIARREMDNLEAGAAEARRELAETQAEAEAETSRLANELEAARAALTDMASQEDLDKLRTAEAEGQTAMAELRNAMKSVQADLEEQRRALGEEIRRSDRLNAEKQEALARMLAMRQQQEAAITQYEAVVHSLTWRWARKILDRVETLRWPKTLWRAWLSRQSLRRRRADIKLLRSSSWFDVGFYLTNNQDVEKAQVDPVQHYYDHGAAEGRCPSAKFSSDFYLQTHRDVADGGLNPLVHYLRYGRQEGREIQPASWTVPGAAAPGAAGDHPVRLSPYQSWTEVNSFTPRRRQVLLDRLERLDAPPLISIVMPVYNPPLEYLQKAIATVTAQAYPHWELCIADDYSTAPRVRPFLENWARTEPRIKVAFRERNGHISKASNSAAKLASGEFLVFLDQDDELEPDALGEIALHLADHPDTDVLYTDDDKVDGPGARFAPQFKPEWSPELLHGYMYFSHIFAVRTELFQTVGGFRHECIGSQDYDLALRATRLARRVGHIPRILYHWRVLEGSTAYSGNEKGYSFDSALKALDDTLRSEGRTGKAEQAEWAKQCGIGIFSIKYPDSGPSVAIVIPTKNMLPVLKRCVESLDRTTYDNFKVYIIDTGSDDKACLKYLAKCGHTVLNIVSPGNRFNYAYVNNRAVETVSEDMILFLNNDIEVINPRWLSQMVGQMQAKGVGAVGARLLFPDDTIQHAGIVHGAYRGTLPAPAFKNMTVSAGGGYLSYACTTRNCLAVTAACLLTPRSLFLDQGGFNEVDFSVAYNDVDFCYRLHLAGHRIVYCAEAELYHYEGSSRGTGLGNDNPREEMCFVEKYRGMIDPFQNPNLWGSRYEISSRTVETQPVPPFAMTMVTHNLNYEGAPRSMMEIVKGVLKTGTAVPTVLSPCDGPLRTEYEALGVPVMVLDGFTLLQATDEKEYRERSAGLREAMKTTAPDVVYGNTVLSWWAVEAAADLGLPSIWNIRESETPFSHFDLNASVVKEHARRCLEYPYQVAFVAEATRKVFAPLCVHHNFAVIHNGFDPARLDAQVRKLDRETARRELGIGSGETAVLLPGTVCERKGQIDLVKAIGELGDDVVSRAVFFIVGDRESDYSKALHRKAEALPANRRARLKIVRECGEIGKYYMAADIMVCSSRIESFPKIIQEAMHFGLAIATTPVFGIREQVIDGQSALFYAPGDIDNLTDKLKKLITDELLRRLLGENARITLRTHPSYDEMSGKYNQLFREAWLTGRPRICVGS
ncbi:MAG: glycosyltransferase [Pseudodesulfovibrio sp.]